MGTKLTSSCLKKATDDEPIFVLRAQDQLSADCVRDWAQKFMFINTDENGVWLSEKAEKKYNAALSTAYDMERWPVKKLPD